MRRLLLLLLAALVLGGCSLLGGGDDGSEPTPSPSAAQEPEVPATAWDRAKAGSVAAGGTLRLAIGSFPTSFNPVHADGDTVDVRRLLGPTTGSAVRITADGGWELDTRYARSVQVVEQDPLAVRVRLEPEAVWQDGTPIRAADMTAAWRALSGRDGAFQVADTDGWDEIAAVEAADDGLEYVVRFEQPRTDWPRFVYPPLPASVTKDAETFNESLRAEAPPSNGPFVVSGIDEETGTITQRRNPRWWGRKPKLQSVVWRIAAPDVQAEAFAADEIDVIGLDASTADDVDADRVQRSAGSELTQLTLNAGRGALRDRDVRLAVVAAVDRAAIARTVAEPLGAQPRTVDSLLTVPAQQGYTDAGGERLAHDPARARRLLERAGYAVSDGEDPKATRDGRQLTLVLPVPADTPTVDERAAEIAADLAAVGIAVERPTVDPDDLASSVLVPLDFDLLTFSWEAPLLGVEGAAERFRPVDSRANLTGVATGSAEAWDRATQVLDPEELRPLVRALDEALLDAAVMLPLAEVPVVLAVREGVVNVGAAAFEEPDWTVAGFRAED